MNGSDATKYFDLIDRIASLDVGGRGMTPLYDAARARSGQPLCSAAARHLTDLHSGDSVMLLTGSIVRGWVSLELGDSDGPIGTAALARTLNYGFNVVPVVLTDVSLMKSMSATLEAAGLTVVTADQARAAVLNKRFTAVAVVESCSTEDRAAEREARMLHDRYHPRVVISIERAGLTADDTFRNSVGIDYSAGRSRLDYIVREAQAHAVPTIGIGDYGNEIGMGAIREAVEKHMPNGKTVCAQLATDVIFPTGVSNWGCYAIQAALAILTGRTELAHSADLEHRLLAAAPQFGLIDGLSGKREATADDLPLTANMSVVSLLETVVQRACR